MQIRYRNHNNPDDVVGVTLKCEVLCTNQYNTNGLEIKFVFPDLSSWVHFKAEDNWE